MRGIEFDCSQFNASIRSWYRTNNRSLPWRELWCEKRDPYLVWLSEIMLQQTLIKVVIPAYQKFLTEFPSIDEVARASEDSVRLACRGLGYYRRFGLFYRAARELVSRKEFVWPSCYEEWKTLPGIGDYTAAAIASIVNNEMVAVLDGNVERVLCRILDIRKPIGSPGLKPILKKYAQELITDVDPGAYNQGMMELGQLICTKSDPSCRECPVRKYCLAEKNGSQSLAPAAKVRAEPVDVHISIAICVDSEGRLGILPRGASAKFLAGIAGFPSFLVQPSGEMEPLGFVCPKAWGERLLMHKLGSFRHNITHHKIYGTVFRLDGDPFGDLEFFHPSEIESRLVSNLDRKALSCFR
jgi:A/G-specific adenine glycosylase